MPPPKMNLQEFICTENIPKILCPSMEEIITSIEDKIRIFENNKSNLFVSNLELQQIQNQHERYKKATIDDLKELQGEFEKKLQAAKTQYERDLAFVEKLHEEKIAQLNDNHSLEINETVKEYEDEIKYLQGQLEELSNQKKKMKFQNMKSFFFRQIREAKRKVQLLNSERVQMKNHIQTLKKDLLETQIKLKNCQNIHLGDGQNFASSKQITKVEIQFISETKKNETDSNYLINKSHEIKKKLDTLDSSGYTDKIITEIVNEYSRIEMVLNHFKQYNDGFCNKNKKFLKN